MGMPNGDAARRDLFVVLQTRDMDCGTEKMHILLTYNEQTH